MQPCVFSAKTWQQQGHPITRHAGLREVAMLHLCCPPLLALSSHLQSQNHSLGRLNQMASFARGYGRNKKQQETIVCAKSSASIHKNMQVTKHVHCMRLLSFSPAFGSDRQAELVRARNNLSDRSGDKCLADPCNLRCSTMNQKGTK